MSESEKHPHTQTTQHTPESDPDLLAEDATGLRILIVLVVMFVFMFVVGLVALYFVARR
jgi:hypothetical protein